MSKHAIGFLCLPFQEKIVIFSCDCAYLFSERMHTFFEVFGRNLSAETFPIKIQRFENLRLGNMLVDTHIAHLSQQGEVDDSAFVLFVVRHQFVKCVILLATEHKRGIIFFDVIDHLAKFLHRESANTMREE